MIENRSGEIDQAAGFGSQDAPAYEPSLFVDSHTLTYAEGTDVTQLDANEVATNEPDANEPDALDELRAATTAADAHPEFAQGPELSTAQVAEIRRLHEVTVAAEQRTGRVLATPRARRRLHDAVTEESDALHMLGFSTFEEFEIADAARPPLEARDEHNAETIARIAEILAEIGIDPSTDPLEAARDFLALHEDELHEDELHEDELHEDEVRPFVEPPSTTWAHPPIAEYEMIAAPDEATPLAVEEEPAATLHEAATAIEMAAARVEAANAAIDEADTFDEALAVAAAAEPGAEAPAEIPPAVPPASVRDDEIVDRWISAEARAERMHAEVDRAQAELVALLARSAELESTVVERVNERDNATADLDEARARVAELEDSIARFDLERAQTDATIASAHDRVAELEGEALGREQAYAQSELDRAAALDSITALEADLATRTSELEQARASVAQLEAQIGAHAAELDLAREQLEASRADVAGWRTELETTRRSISALDEHAEAIEAELAEARRQAQSPDVRRELEAARQELTAARNEVGDLETRRAEAEALLARDRAELEHVERSLATTRDLTAAARNELSAARNALEATKSKVESAERARQAITIDAAEILARAEAGAANMLERAGRDAEAIRQEARLENPDAHTDNEAITMLAEHVDRLERKLSKRLRKLDESSHDVARDARRDRDRFREELVALLARLTPTEDD